MKTTRKYPALGILFKGEMVRAIQAGRKTQTRRILNPQPLRTERRWVREAEVGTLHVTQDMFGEGLVFALRESMTTTRNLGAVNFAEEFAPIKVGEILYMKETWYEGYPTDDYGNINGPSQYWYRADAPSDARPGDVSDSWCINEWGEDNKDMWPRWKSSMFMPYAAARIFLKVTGVRVERLNDISEADAWAEGCKRGEPTDNGGFFPAEIPDPGGIGLRGWDSPEDWYADLWEEINGEGSWDANPWVWVYTFERTEKPATE